MTEGTGHKRGAVALGALLAFCFVLTAIDALTHRSSTPDILGRYSLSAFVYSSVMVFVALVATGLSAGLALRPDDSVRIVKKLTASKSRNMALIFGLLLFLALLWYLPTPLWRAALRLLTAPLYLLILIVAWLRE